MSETEAKSEACETDVRESDNVNTCAGGTARVPANYIRSARSLITVLSVRAVCARAVRVLSACCVRAVCVVRPRGASGGAAARRSRAAHAKVGEETKASAEEA